MMSAQTNNVVEAVPARRQDFAGVTLRAACNVVAVASLLSGAAYYAARRFVFIDTKAHFAKIDERAIASGVELFAMETGRAPADLSELVPAYIKELHSDPWGHEYLYARSGQSFSIVSLGKDNEQGSEVTVVTGSLPSNNSQNQNKERHSP